MFIPLPRGRVVEREERTHGAARGQLLINVGRDLDGAAEPVRRLGLEGYCGPAHDELLPVTAVAVTACSATESSCGAAVDVGAGALA